MTNLAITRTTYIQLVPTTGTRVSVQIPDGYPKVQALTDNGPLNSRLFHCHTGQACWYFASCHYQMLLV